VATVQQDMVSEVMGRLQQAQRDEAIFEEALPMMKKFIEWAEAEADKYPPKGTPEWEAIFGVPEYVKSPDYRPTRELTAEEEAKYVFFEREEISGGGEAEGTAASGAEEPPPSSDNPPPGNPDLEINGVTSGPIVRTRLNDKEARMWPAIPRQRGHPESASQSDASVVRPMW